MGDRAVALVRLRQEHLLEELARAQQPVVGLAAVLELPRQVALQQEPPMAERPSQLVQVEVGPAERAAADLKALEGAPVARVLVVDERERRQINRR